MNTLIAEISNNHLGDMNKAKEYIRIAAECGATMAKGQAFLAKDIVDGSMPDSFYYQCQLEFDEYVELIEYGKQIGIPVFFSIFSRKLESLSYHQDYYKIAGSQIKLSFKDLRKKDTKNTFISIPEFSLMPEIKKSNILCVTPYMVEKINWAFYSFLESYYGRPIGLSCHCIDINETIAGIKKFNIQIVEKHLTLERDIKYNSAVFRDSQHACLPNGLEKLARELV